MFAFPTNGDCRILKRRSLWGNCSVILAAKKKRNFIVWWRPFVDEAEYEINNKK
jgi:hypothetical protein